MYHTFTFHVLNYGIKRTQPNYWGFWFPVCEAEEQAHYDVKIHKRGVMCLPWTLQCIGILPVSAVPTEFCEGKGKGSKHNKLSTLCIWLNNYLYWFSEHLCSAEALYATIVDCILFYQKVGIKSRRNLPPPSWASSPGCLVSLECGREAEHTDVGFSCSRDDFILAKDKAECCVEQ